jgi:hypothetical protein
MSALNAAVKRRLIAFNPAAFVELESGRRPKAVVWTDARVAVWRTTGERPKAAVWTPAQTGAFLDHARDDRLSPLFTWSCSADCDAVRPSVFAGWTSTSKPSP